MPGLHVHHPNHVDPCRHQQILDFAILGVVAVLVEEEDYHV